ncbi:PP2C family protein-serine/threonine phosphatase [Paenibacillus daejeonensis]|uniref:PP2C family protein-serine/threonine phosphatase n=1 Tax=Paenibacillus daejeonensis TaxID=135193 RepID=UPI000361B4A4|nr:GAF domain-containing SpoIIE family protein phosphatase [Paenibacillus daejeonensis]
MSRKAWLSTALAGAAAGAGMLLARERRRSSQLLAISLRLNSTLRRGELLQIIMETAEEALDAEASSIIMVDASTGELYFEVATGERGGEVKQIRLQPGEGIAGSVAASGQSVRIADAARDARWSSRVSNRVGMPTRSMLCVPVRSGERTLGVLQVINRKGGGAFSQAQLRLLEDIAAPVAIALENMLLYEALEQSMLQLRETTAAKERLESELKIAREIQSSYLPGSSWRMPGVELNASLEPAREVGGDFYHYQELGDGRLLICLGDVSDKGMPAALFMSGLMIWIRAKANGSLKPSQIVAHINREISSEESTMFATMFLGILDTASGELQYCDAGHCPAYVVGQQGANALTGHKNLPIGIFADADYADNHIRLSAGESLVLYTDGITEAEDSAGHWFGAERLAEQLSHSVGCSAEEIVFRLSETIELFAAGMPQHDDQALMVLNYG